jgi:type IV pilus assembly protein PilO
MPDISLTKLPWYAQVGAFVALAVGGCGAFVYYYELPARADIELRQSQLTRLRGDIVKGTTTAKKLPEFRDQVAELESRLSGLKAVLPGERDAADLLRRMQTVATQSNLVIKGFKPSPTVTKQLHAEWPIALELEGTFHNLATFFDRVGKFAQIVNVSGLDVKALARPDPRSTITATCVATTFVLLDKPDTKAAAKPAGTPPAAKGA